MVIEKSLALTVSYLQYCTVINHCTRHPGQFRELFAFAPRGRVEIRRIIGDQVIINTLRTTLSVLRTVNH
jgi:hypothetical protein